MLSNCWKGIKVMRIRYLALGCLLILAAALAGCGTGKTVKVEGIVLLDGQPVSGASVRFIPLDAEKGLSANGLTGTDGRFRLTTRKPNDGAMPGEYRIEVSYEEQRESAAGVDMSRPDKAMEVMRKAGEESRATGGPAAPKGGKGGKIPPGYGTKDSPLRQTVPPDGDVKIELKSTGG
jgi:hypothetical protein